MMTRSMILGSCGLCAVIALAIPAILTKAQAENKQPASGSLSREAAVKMVKAYLASHKIDRSPGLNDKNLGGADVNGQQVYFEYIPDKKLLKSSALVYRFNKPPKPGVIDGFKKEEASGTDTGGGTVEYMKENQGLFLSRTYTSQVPDASFVSDTGRLLSASIKWGNEVLERVSQKVFHGG